MTEIVQYVSHELCNPSAAETLADEMIDAAETLDEREKRITVARVMYARRDSRCVK